MPKRILFLLGCCLTLVFCGTLSAQSGTWAVSGGGSFSELPGGIEVDDEGNTYVCGSFRDSIQIEGQTFVSDGEEDIYIAKYDTNGSVIWAKKFGWWHTELAYDLALDDFGHLYVAFQFRDSTLWNSDTVVAYWRTADLGVIKMDTGGNYLRFQFEGGRGREFPYDIECDGDGNVVMTGVFRSHTIFGLDTLMSRGFDDVFITVMDSNMQFQWGRRLGGNEYDRGLRVAVVDDSIYAITGYFADTLYTVEDSSQYLVSAGEDDMYVAMYDRSGDFYWAKRGGGPGIDRGYGIEFSPNRDIYVAGQFEGTMAFESLNLTSAGESDGFLMQLNSTGVPQWGKSLGGTGFDAIQGLDRRNSGELVTTGFFQGTAMFDNQPINAQDSMDTDAFFASYDGSGSFQWVNSGGGDSYDQGLKAAVDHLGNTFVCGTFTGEAWFGQQTLVSNGADDYMLMRIGPTGKVSRDPGLEIAELSVKVYPNPTRHVSKVRMTLPSSMRIFWEVRDLQGRLVAGIGGERAYAAGEQEIQLDLSQLPDGMYVYRLNTPMGSQSGKIIKAN